MRQGLSLEYIAGFFDGEGCVAVYHNQRRRFHLEEVLPYLRIKREQAEIAIAWQRQRPAVIRNAKGQVQLAREEDVEHNVWVSNRLKELKKAG